MCFNQKYGCVLCISRNYCNCICYVFSTEIEIKPREGERIHRIFQDPLAQHLIVCLESRDCMYVGRSRQGKRAIPRLLPKVKGHLIESVAWNKVEQTEFTTGPILLGSNNGQFIFAKTLCIKSICLATL